MFRIEDIKGMYMKLACVRTYEEGDYPDDTKKQLYRIFREYDCYICDWSWIPQVNRSVNHNYGFDILVHKSRAIALTAELVEYGVIPYDHGSMLVEVKG